MGFEDLLIWSRAQFALTAGYHWLFVPLTLGLGVIMAIAETIYFRTHKPEWKKWAKFWQKLFGINFAIGVATGIILEFEFGTNWSNYSWLVGDIFGAPLAIEGILAFFMEATFIAVMFFGWDRVSRRFHLASTWLTIIGATISAVWILVANAWMQDPVGVTFNPDTVRGEMTDFWAVAFSSTAVNKFWHTVSSAWVLGSIFALFVCAIYSLRKDTKHHNFAYRNARMIAPFGLIAAIITAFTGDTSAYNVAQKQPMKLAAMEALYEAGQSTPDGQVSTNVGQPLSVIGLLDFDKLEPLSEESSDPFVANIEIPYLLSWLGTKTMKGYVPGINNILRGDYYHADGTKALSAEEMMARGKMAVDALKSYHEAKKSEDLPAMESHRQVVMENFQYFGYGHIEDVEDLVPNVPVNYYAFRLMVGCGLLFILLFVLVLVYVRKPEKYHGARWLQVVIIVCLPLVYLASQSGWVVAEMGRQPWTIQNMLPVNAAVSALETHSVLTTFIIFAVLFTIMLVAEISIMVKSIKMGPQVEDADSSPSSKVETSGKEENQ